MTRELLSQDVEHTDVEKKRKMGLTIVKNLGISLSDVPENLGLNPGLNEIDWLFRKNQLAIQNYLENNELNTDTEDVSALSILSKHGITRDNFKDFFNDSVTASNLTAAYEATHSQKEENDGQEIDNHSYAA